MIRSAFLLDSNSLPLQAGAETGRDLDFLLPGTHGGEESEVDFLLGRSQAAETLSSRRASVVWRKGQGCVLYSSSNPRRVPAQRARGIFREQ